MSVRPAPQLGTAPTADSASAAERHPRAGARVRDAPRLAGAPSDVWVRTLPLWHVWNLGILAATTLVALTAIPMPGPAAATAVGLAALLAAMYVALFVRHSRQWGWWWSYGVPYAAAISVCFGVLVQLNPYFAYLEFTLYPQIFFLLYGRRAAVVLGAVGMGTALVLAELAAAGGRLDAALPHIVPELAQIGLSFGFALWIAAMASQSIERRLLIEELERTRNDLVAAEREAGVLEERGRLAREIHDTLAQGFASVVAHIEAAKGSLGQDEARVVRHLDEAEDAARHSLADARGLAWALRPDAIGSGGLPAAMERAVSSAFRGSGVRASTTVTGTARALHPNVEVTLLRAAQEAIANARRHAHAREVTVTLTYFPDAVALDVADDGVGFDPERVVPGPSGGLGLAGLRERLASVGGTVVVESATGQGTTIGVSVPTSGRPGTSPSVGEIA